MGVLKEIWTGELVKAFRFDHKWLSRIQSRDNLVDNNVIHLVDVGADPTVLINNSSYPISVNAQTDSDIAISLDKFDTENTKVTKDELYAISYDKMAAVIDNHRRALEQTTAEKALHALAPAVDDDATNPLVKTTGADITGVRKRLKVDDVVTLKAKMDALGIPQDGRVLVLCNEHVEDLLLTSETFVRQYKDIRTGEILRLHGFDIYEDQYAPKYDDTTFHKKAYGAAGGNEHSASVAFYAPRAFKAMGSVEMFYRDAKEDPENRMNTVGFRVYFVCLPKKITGFAAIVSDNPSA